MSIEDFLFLVVMGCFIALLMLPDVVKVTSPITLEQVVYSCDGHGGFKQIHFYNSLFSDYAKVSCEDGVTVEVSLDKK